jgi:hypothetical protein
MFGAKSKGTISAGRDEKAGNPCSGKTFKIEEFDAEQNMKKKTGS